MQSESIKILSRILNKREDTTIGYYNSLKEMAKGKELEEIDFSVYDKMSFMVNDFNMKLYNINIDNNSEFLKFVLDLDKGVYALLMDLQGRFVKNSEDIKSQTYIVLGEMIKNKEEQIFLVENTLIKNGLI